MARQPQLDTIRNIAFLWVVSFHVLEELAYVSPSIREATRSVFFRPIWAGDLSVDVFFLLSGHLCFHRWRQAFAGSTSSLKGWVQYVLDKWVRLAPVAFVVAGLYAAITQQIDCRMCKEERTRCRKYWWHNALFFHNFFPFFTYTCMEWTWYLSLQFQCYVLLPFLASARPLWRWLAILLSIGLGLRAIWLLPLATPNTGARQVYDLSAYLDTYYSVLHTRIFAFIMGVDSTNMWRAAVKVAGPAKIRSTARLTCAAVLVVTIGCWDANLPGPPAMYAHLMWSRVIFSLAFALLLGELAVPDSPQPSTRHNQRWNFINERLARLSFAGYLWHPISLQLITFVFPLSPKSSTGQPSWGQHLHAVLTLWLYMLLVVLSAVGVAALLHHAVEVPVGRWYKQNRGGHLERSALPPLVASA